MSTVVTCSCGKKLVAKDELAGKVVQCPACHERIQVPAAARSGVHAAPAKPEESGSRKVWLIAGLAIAGVVLCGALAVGYFAGKRTQTTGGDARPANSTAPKVPPSITATPNPVPAGEGKFGTTTITWDTGDGSIGQVYVSVNGAAEKRFAGGPKGSMEAPWIGKGDHDFRLYAGKEHKTLLASVRVTRNK